MLKRIRNPFAPMSLSEFCSFYRLSEEEATLEIIEGRLVADLVDAKYSISFDSHTEWRRAREPWFWHGEDI